MVFPADEGAMAAIAEVPADIPIVDDTIDENLQQYFVAHLEIIHATNFDHINDHSMNVAICIIIDNDGKQSWHLAFY